MKITYSKIVNTSTTSQKLTVKYSLNEAPIIERLYPNLSNLITLSKQYAVQQK